MADITLINQGLLNGTYDGNALNVDTNVLSTTLISGLVATKAADKNVWLSGNLTYTITIVNGADEDFVNPILTDTLDIAQIKLVEDSVEINDIPTTYTYNDVSGLLTVSVPTIAASATTTVRFEVEKI